MKNVSVSAAREPHKVAHQGLIHVMNGKKRYTQEEVCALLPDRPKMAVRETLAALVDKGVIWRDASGARVRYSLLEGERLQDAIERKTIYGPSNWVATITGYDAAQRQFRELCETTRK